MSSKKTDEEGEGELVQCKQQIAQLQRVIQEKDELIASLRSKLSSMHSQMEIQKHLLEAELRKSNSHGMGITNTFVNDGDLDDMTQSWLASELANPGLLKDHEEDEDDDQESSCSSATNEEQTNSSVADSMFGPAQTDSISSKLSVMLQGSEISLPVPASESANKIPVLEVTLEENTPQISNSSEEHPTIVAVQIDVEGATTTLESQHTPRTNTNTESTPHINEASTGKSGKLSADHFGSSIRKMKSISTWKGRKNMMGTPIMSEPILSIPADALEELRNYEFDAFSKSNDDLIRFVVYIYQDLHLNDLFMIKPSTLARFIRAVSEEYRPNPYHNFYHSVDVTQTLYYYILRSNSRDILSPLDILCLVTSALCHDVGHPGQNNAFQINSQSEFARIYNDSSVLESHHAAKTFEILRRFEYPNGSLYNDTQTISEYFVKKKNGEFMETETTLNILSSLSNNQFKEARKNIINMILMTDMAKHFEMTAKMSTLAKKSEDSEDPVLSSENRDDREFLCALLLHCADISNVTKPFSIGKKWADRVRDEFYQQGDTEKLYGLPVSPYMDREDSNQARTTLNFIDFVAAPLFTSVSILLRGLELTCTQLAENRQKWQDILEQQLSEPVAAPQIASSNTPLIASDATNIPTISAPAQSPALLQPDTIKKDNREFDKMAYRRRSVMVFQTLSQVDENARRRSGSKSSENRLLPTSWLNLPHNNHEALPTVNENKDEQLLSIAPKIEQNPGRAASPVSSHPLSASSPPHIVAKKGTSPKMEALKAKQIANEPIPAVAQINQLGPNAFQAGRHGNRIDTKDGEPITPPQKKPSESDMRLSREELISHASSVSGHAGSVGMRTPGSTINGANPSLNGNSPINTVNPKQIQSKTMLEPGLRVSNTATIKPLVKRTSINPTTAGTKPPSRGGFPGGAAGSLSSSSTSSATLMGFDGVIIGNGTNHHNTRGRPDSAHSTNAAGGGIIAPSSSASSSTSSAALSISGATRAKGRLQSPSATYAVSESEQLFAIDNPPHQTGGLMPRRTDGGRKSQTSLTLDGVNGKALPPLRGSQKPKTG